MSSIKSFLFRLCDTPGWGLTMGILAGFNLQTSIRNLIDLLLGEVHGVSWILVTIATFLAGIYCSYAFLRWWLPTYVELRIDDRKEKEEWASLTKQTLNLLKY